MENGFKLILTLMIGMVGGLLGKKYKLPAGALVGAILSVAFCNVLTQQMYFPSDLRTYVQIASGAFVGSRIKKSDLSGLSYLASSAAVLVAGMFVMNVVLGSFLYYTTDLDIATAFYGTAPGGMQDMGLISQDFGADPVMVSVIQLVRLVFVLSFFPLFYRLVSKGTKLNETKHSCEKEVSLVKQDQLVKEEVLSKKEKIKRFLCTVVLAWIGGKTFKCLGISGGALTGSMTFVVGFGMFTGKVFFPRRIRTFIQLFAGAYIGAQMNANSLNHMKTLVLPLIGLCIGLIVFTYLISLGVRKCSKLEKVTCMLMSTPGGLSEMTLLAEEFDCNVPKVVLMHTVRVLVVISLFPTLLGALMKIFI